MVVVLLEDLFGAWLNTNRVRLTSFFCSRFQQR